MPYDKYRLDVAYMNGGAVVGGVEVLHSSRVSDEKFRFLGKNLPWCEVKAENVLKSTGHIFAERSHNQVCESCKRIEAFMIAENARKERIREQRRLKQLEEERMKQERLEQDRLERERLEKERRIMRARRIEDERRRRKLEYELFQKRMKEEELEYERKQKEREQKRLKRREEEKKERRELLKRKAREKIERAWSVHLKDMELYNKLLN